MANMDGSRQDAEIKSVVEKSYEQILDLVLQHRLRPGERINETELSRHLGVSRTPLREALNRLASEDFLVIRPGKGFFCRDIVPDQILELFQLRAAVETAAVKLAVLHGRDEEIAALLAFLDETAEPSSAPVPVLVGFDERFHEAIVKMARNNEMLRLLRTINMKIRSVRWIDLDRRGRTATQGEHRAIIEAIGRRDGAGAAELMDAHISRRLDEIEAVIRDLYGRIYVAPTRAVWEQT